MVGNSKYRYLLFGFSIFIVNLILKIWFITDNDISHDEPFTLFFAQGSPSEIISNLIPYNNPPLYELLLHYWIELFGIDPLDVRLFSCLISCVSAVVLFYFARKLWNDRVAWFAVLFFTFSTFQISFAHETRSYALFFLFSMCSMFYFLQLVFEDRKKNQILYIVFTILLLYTHFFSLWIIFVQVIILLIRRQIFHTRFLIPAFVILILFLPYIFILWQRFNDSAGGTWLEKPTWDALYENIRHFSNQPIVAVMVIMVFITGIYFLFRNSQEKTAYLLIWFFVPYILMFVISFWLPMFLGRYLIFITPAFIFLWAVFTDEILKFKSSIKYLVLLPAILFVFTVNPRPSIEQEPAKVAKILEPYYNNETMIVLSPVSLDLQIMYHLDKELFKYNPEYRRLEKEKNIIPENDVTKLTLPDKMIFVETEGGGYMDKGRKNYVYLCEHYSNVIELKYNGEKCKAFSIFYFENLR